MYLDSNRFADAQNVLVAAGKQAPRDGDIYRWLGETLLRRGDADRAEKVLQRAIQLGASGPDARVWLERARVFRPMQAKAGTRAVAAEVAHTSPAGARAARLHERQHHGRSPAAAQGVLEVAPGGRPGRCRTRARRGTARLLEERPDVSDVVRPRGPR